MPLAASLAEPSRRGGEGGSLPGREPQKTHTLAEGTVMPGCTAWRAAAAPVRLGAAVPAGRRTMVSAASLSWMVSENTVAGQGERRGGDEGQVVRAQVRARPSPPTAWVEPTPMSTVERTATPTALPTWRIVLKRVEARPMRVRRDLGEGRRLVGHEDLGHHPSQQEHEHPDQPQIRGQADLGEDEHRHRQADQPPGDVAARADAGVDETARELRADHDAERLGKRRETRLQCTRARGHPENTGG